MYNHPSMFSLEISAPAHLVELSREAMRKKKA
jgi:hypothetical protein